MDDVCGELMKDRRMVVNYSEINQTAGNVDHLSGLSKNQPNIRLPPIPNLHIGNDLTSLGLLLPLNFRGDVHLYTALQNEIELLFMYSPDDECFYENVEVETVMKEPVPGRTSMEGKSLSRLSRTMSMCIGPNMPSVVKRVTKEIRQVKHGLLYKMTEIERILLNFALQSISSLSFDTILVDRLTHGNALMVLAYVLFKRHGLFRFVWILEN
jgi:hypothetical protein